MTGTISSPQRIILIGMMGAGKTTIGRALAADLGWRFWDNDEQFVTCCGRTARAVFETDGPGEVHRIEMEVFRRALEAPTPLVVAAPGSVALVHGAAELLRNEEVVWLRAAVETRSPPASPTIPRGLIWAATPSPPWPGSIWNGNPDLPPSPPP